MRHIPIRGRGYKIDDATKQSVATGLKRIEDAAIEDALRRALGEARTALRLDPENEQARKKVAILQEKLVRLASELQSPR